MNKSVMKCCICDNKNTGEFITIKDKKYHLCCIEDLQQRIDKTIEYINREDICIDIRDNELNYISTNELLKILKGDSNA